MKEKKIILIAILLLMFSVTIFAQGITAKGFKGGLNIVKFTGSDADIGDEVDPKFAMGFAVGGFLTYSINNQISIRPEILYSVKGSKYEEDGLTLDFTMNYIDIPVLGVISVQKNMSIFAGPYFGMFLSGKVKIEYGGDSEEEDMNKEDYANDFGLVFGGSYDISNNLSIEARYALGLKTFDKEPDDWDSSYGNYEVLDIKNSAIQIMVNYSF